jgi:hypothetical protein
MDNSRKSNREDNEVTLQYQSPQEALQLEELNSEKLSGLLASIEQLKQTPAGEAEIQRRIKVFGACERIEGETSGQFYGRLCSWLERCLPQTKLPRHPPRQSGE